ncbi:MAG: hypothetical protein K6A23_15685 [Butyrivibrio sp.]|nr:hypothetical protein [Butyrivibrio sp.]
MKHLNILRRLTDKRIFKSGSTYKFIVLASVSGLFLTGCTLPAALDEYLQDLGILDPEEYRDVQSEADSAGYEGSDASTGISMEVIDSMKEAVEADADSSGYESSLLLQAEAELSAARQESQNDEEQTPSYSEVELSDSDFDGLYAYEQLDDEGKNLYTEIYSVLTSLGEDVVVSTLDKGDIKTAFNYCMADHPEIFYVTGYTYKEYTLGDEIQKISFSGTYTYNESEIKNRQNKIDSYVAACLAGIDSNADQYSKVKYVYEYIINSTDYVADAEDNQNICSVFINNKSVCQGYAKAAQYLLNKLGIESVLVTGTVQDSSGSWGGHAWNLVNIDGQYYYVDTTWGDASYQTQSGDIGDNQRIPTINYFYLNVTTDELSKTHRISNELPMPECTSMVANYYVKEDEYFESCDADSIKALFDRRLSDGSNNVTIKCSSADVYQEIYDMLVTDRGIFDYLNGEDHEISYTMFKNQNTMIFWL